MDANASSILSVNGGSSSIKFALYKPVTTLVQVFHGSIENIAQNKSTLTFTDNATARKKSIPIQASDFEEASMALIDFLEEQKSFTSIKAIGHRVVHGMRHSAPEKITDALLAELRQISSYDPEHLPGEIRLIELFRKRHPALIQIACFDTAFHAGMPAIATMLSLPRSYFAKGIRRYGFHGLSYAFLMQELQRVAGHEAAQGKIILAHLGSGASLAAVKEGNSVDTSMGFTPTSGLPMATRSGDLDPGVAWYTMQFEKLSPGQFSHLVNHESGLLGISGSSGDMQELLASQHSDSHAAEAIDFFCYQAKKWVGSFAGVLSGLNTLVFSGGIGSHAPEVRSKICDGLSFLGIELDEIKNMDNDAIISAEASTVTVRVIKTNEELIIARFVSDVLNIPIG